MNPTQLQQNLPRQTSPEEREYLRDLSAGRLRDIADYIDQLNGKGWTESDYQIDDLLRTWGKVDLRPGYRNPHEGLWPTYVPQAKPKIDILNYPAGSLEAKYAKLRPTLKIRDDKQSEVLRVAGLVRQQRGRYQSIEKSTGVPWWFVAAIHTLESVPFMSFGAYLGNGEPLNRVTQKVPKNRGPWSSWEAGAIDAIRYDGLDERKDWSFAGACAAAERYNGLGYFRRKLNSPYTLSCTNEYEEGKFVEVRVNGSYVSRYDPNLKSQQVGAVALWLALGVV